MSNKNLTTRDPKVKTYSHAAKTAGSLKSRRFIKGTLASLAASMMLATSMAGPANAALSQTGPIDPASGFPTWFEDSNGLRLDLCLTGDLCLGALPDPTQPVSVPNNFPDEAFWWAADASIESGGVDALLVLSQEAAFTNDVAEAGEQVVFSRLRIRISGLTPGAIYTITHPYGTISLPANGDGVINYTKDYGCFDTPCTQTTFDRALNGPVSGPFLTWDTGAPLGYIGDPNVDHTVTGSPTGNNFFQVEGPNVGGEGVNSITTDLFALQGKISGVDAPTPPPAVDPVDGDPVDGEPDDDAPVDGVPVDDAPVDGVPVDDAPVDDAPVDDAPVDDAPVDDAPVDGVPVDDAPVDDAPVDGVPVDDAPVDEAPPVDGVPVDEAPPVDGVPADEAAKDAAKAAADAAKAEAKAAEEAAKAQAVAIREEAKLAEEAAKAEAKAAADAAKAEAKAAEEAAKAQAVAVREQAKAAEETAKAEAKAAEEAAKAQAKANAEAVKVAEKAAKDQAKAAEEAAKAQAKAAKDAAKAA